MRIKIIIFFRRYIVQKQPPEVFYNERQACNFIKKETLAQAFSCEFCEFLRTPFLQNTSERLLLIVQKNDKQNIANCAM